MKDKSKEKTTPDVQQVDESLPESDVAIEVSTIGLAASDIETLRERHAQEYERRTRAEFEQARQIAEDRLSELEATGFNPSRGPLDEMSTADAIEKSIAYDYPFEGNVNETDGPASQNEHAKKHEVK